MCLSKHALGRSCARTLKLPIYSRVVVASFPRSCWHSILCMCTRLCVCAEETGTSSDVGTGGGRSFCSGDKSADTALFFSVVSIGAQITESQLVFRMSPQETSGSILHCANLSRNDFINHSHLSHCPSRSVWAWKALPAFATDDTGTSEAVTGKR